MPFLFCFVYARLPFFRNFLERKRDVLPQLLQKKNGEALSL